MLILSSISSGLELWSVNHTSMYENSELNVFTNITFLGEISNNWPNVYQEQMYTRLLDFVDNRC